MKKLAIPLTAAALALVSMTGCSTTRTLPLQTTSLASAADGEVKVKPAGVNTEVSVDVKHLAPPDRLDPGAEAYVLWVQPLNASARPQNMGVLEVNKNREGRIQTLTPFRTFEVFVTAEPSPSVDSPTGERVMYTQVVPRG